MLFQGYRSFVFIVAMLCFSAEANFLCSQSIMGHFYRAYRNSLKPKTSHKKRKHIGAVHVKQIANSIQIKLLPQTFLDAPMTIERWGTDKKEHPSAITWNHQGVRHFLYLRVDKDKRFGEHEIVEAGFPPSLSPKHRMLFFKKLEELAETDRDLSFWLLQVEGDIENQLLEID